MPLRFTAPHLDREMRAYDLSQPVSATAPHMPGSQPAYQMTLWTSSERTIAAARRHGATNDPGVNVEMVTATYHVGTHVDALGHFSRGNCLHADKEVADVVGVLGLRELDAAQIPTLIAPAVVFDLAHLDGGQHLAAGRSITDRDLSAYITANDIDIPQGAVALLHTGWGQFYGDRSSRYATTCPGINLAAAKLLTQYQVAAIGADTMAVEVVPPEDPAIVMPVHMHTLVDQGVYLIENLNLAALAQDKVRECTFLMCPLNLPGATASPIRPFAFVKQE